MFIKIFLFVLAGVAILHLLRLKKLDEKNPNLKLIEVIGIYLGAERFYIFVSVIGLIVFSVLLNVGLAPTLSKMLLGFVDVIDTESKWGLWLVSFFAGLSMQGIIMWVAKRGEASAERVLMKMAEKNGRVSSEGDEKK